MPLSDYERRRLRELERDLADDDPVLARELTTGKPPGLWLRWSAGIVLVLVGLGDDSGNFRAASGFGRPGVCADVRRCLLVCRARGYRFLSKTGRA